MKISDNYFYQQNIVNRNFQNPNRISSMYKTASLKEKEANSNNTMSLPKPHPFIYPSYKNISFGQGIFEDKQPFLILSSKQDNSERIYSELTLSSGRKSCLCIEENIVNRFLRKEDSEIDTALLQKFISVYKYILEDVTRKDKKEDEFLISVLEGRNKAFDNKVRFLSPGDEARNALSSSLTASDEDFVETFFSKINNEQLRNEYASILLEQGKRSDKAREDIAKQRTIYLFDMCKTQEGYDFSSIKEKIEIAAKIESINNNYGDIANMNALPFEIIKHSKNKKGRFDVHFAKALCSLIENTEAFDINTFVSHRSDILRQFTSIDIKHKNQIMENIISLSSIVPIDDTDKTFEDVFILAFNPVTGDFDSFAFEALSRIVKKVDVYTADFVIDSPEDYRKYNDLNIRLIRNYFELIRDKETGKIKPETISPDEYLRHYAGENDINFK